MNSDKLQYYLGHTNRVFCGYTTHPKVLGNCASGGIVSTVLMWLLDNKKVDGCLVYNLQCLKGNFTIIHQIITSSEQIPKMGGSIYMDFPALSSKVMSDIKAFPGKIAVVGLPCSISILKKLSLKDKALREKIVFTIGLFCGHTSKASLLKSFLEIKKINPQKISSFYFRKGLWRGNTEIHFKNGSTTSIPSAHYNTFQNLFIDAPNKCLSCHDHYAEDADLSTGDIWKKEYKNKQTKHSIFTTRTTQADHIIDRIIEEQILCVEKGSRLLLYKANKRAVIFHKAAQAKYLACRFFGYKYKPPKNAPKARWNEIASAFMIIGIKKISDTKYRKILFLLPHKIRYSILIFFKLLTNF